ncbi:MAG: nitrilase [Fusobacteriaceae bacterium]|nr:nitrilase [Fusobacteriaceae bacterium]MBN2838114.1 nitrilase [Fusobacteriaceae bacterium]
MKVCLAQIKPTLGNVKKNLEIMCSNIEKAIEEENNVIVFPELSLTGYLVKDMVQSIAITRKTVPQELLEYSKKIGIIFGAVEEDDEDFRFYNSAFYLEDGEVKHVHRKVYLPTYGLFDEFRYFSKGDKFRAFDTKYGRFGILICEDAFHPSSSYILNEDGCQYMFMLANSPSRGGQGDKPSNLIIWETLAKTYSSLYGMYIVFSHRVGYEDGVNFAGQSKVFSPSGEIKMQLSLFEEDFQSIVLDRAEIRRARIYTPTNKNEDIYLTIRELERIANK